IDLSGNNADEANNCRDDDCNYQVLDSGDESEEDDLNDLDGSDSEVAVVDTVDGDDEEAFDNEERHFADHFLESMGGEEQVLAGEILGPALKEYSTTGWHEIDTPDVEKFLETPYTPHIAECSNVYTHEQLDNRVDTYFEKKTSRERRAKAAGKTVTPTKKTKTRRD
ncbi:hypothetical protein F441_16848, partial [Phytophthora nicotianae CJ01A1]